MIVIPMLGRSQRFFDAGYTVPKYQLRIRNETVFARAVSSFRHYFEDETFLFIIRPDFDTPAFVRQELQKLGVRHYEIRIIAQETAGQAESVFLGLRDAPADMPLTVFNIDTFLQEYKKPPFIDECDGYLEVFSCTGNHWSFVLPGPEQTVIRTTEKERISDLCSNGLYYFRHCAMFRQLFEKAELGNMQLNQELYIAPLYNALIASGGIVRYQVIDAAAIDCCGTPEEYQKLLQR
jgi:hypothetical protein